MEAILASFFFDEVLAPVQLETGWAYLNRDGNILTEAVYEPTYTDSIRDATPTLAAPLQNGYAAVSRDGLWGLLNANGAEALPCAYEASPGRARPSGYRRTASGASRNCRMRRRPKRLQSTAITK